MRQLALLGLKFNISKTNIYMDHLGASWLHLDRHDLLVVWIENPRVVGSIPPPATKVIRVIRRLHAAL